MNYRIEKGQAGWQVCKRKESGKDSKTPGVVSWVPFRYHATVERAALDLLDILIHDSADTNNVSRLIDAIHAAQEEVKVEVVRCLVAK
jgi:hypothetical protein